MSVNGKIVVERDVKLGDYPGRYTEADHPAMGKYHAYHYASSTRHYHVSVAGPKDFVESEDAKRFLGSFKIIANDKVEWLTYAPKDAGCEILFQASPW